MDARKYFPLGKANGEAFCNRIHETEKLVGNIKSGKHTFLVAPRRYGKTSLCDRAFDSSGLPWEKIDFHLAVTEKEAERFIIKGITTLIGKSISQIDKLTNVIKTTVNNLKPRFDISMGPLTLGLEVGSDSTSAENVAEALLLLDRLLVEKQQKAVLLFDEFQEVGEIAKGKGIEGAIRHAAQETKNLSIVFSGSNPHLIKNMFENERRPLYKLCKKLPLFRISAEHYQKHLNHAAQIAWKHNLPIDVFDRIIQMTERHPYYVNALCDELWATTAQLPCTDDVDRSWSTIIECDRSDLVKDFLRLSDNQRKILIRIATFGGKELFSSQAAKEMDIPGGSITRAVVALLEKDFIEQVGNEYHLVVPIYNTLLKAA